mgnify:CR=1 FL=1
MAEQSRKKPPTLPYPYELAVTLNAAIDPIGIATYETKAAANAAVEAEAERYAERHPVRRRRVRTERGLREIVLYLAIGADGKGGRIEIVARPTTVEPLEAAR